MTSKVRERRPTWELVDLLPHQGSWSVEEYLALDTPRYIEFIDGFLEFPPPPDEVHCDVQRFVLDNVRECLARRGSGVYMFSPFKVRLKNSLFRTPDVCVLLDSLDRRRGRQYWAGADLVIEVVSPGGEERDYVEKRADYLAADIPEYWLIDPRQGEVRVLRLGPDGYADAPPLQPGDVARSSVLDGLRLDVAACFDTLRHVSPFDEPPSVRG